MIFTADDLIRQTIEGMNNIYTSLDEHGNTAFHFAVARGHIQAVEELLRNGANPNHRNLLGASVMENSVNSNIPEIVASMKQYGGGNPNLKRTRHHELWRLGKLKVKGRPDVSYYDILVGDELKNSILLRNRNIRRSLWEGLSDLRRFPL